MARVNLAARVLLDPYLRGAYDRVRGESGRKRAWYDRTPASRSSVLESDDWVIPPTPARSRPRSPAARRFCKELRSAQSQLSMRFDELVSSMPPRARAPFFVLCMGTALLLIASARPRTLFASPGLGQPTTIAPSALTP